MVFAIHLKYGKIILLDEEAKIMDVVLLVISVLLITVVLLQSGKAESASNIMMGGNAELFAQRKERGSELFLSRMTLFLGLLFFIICLVLSLM